MSKIWFDITNTPQVHFLLGVKKMLASANNEFIYSTRDFSETVKLLEKAIGNDYIVFGKHHGKSYINKVSGLLNRFWQVYKNIPDFDISISNGSENAIWTSALKRKKSIAFGDNDLARQWTYGRFVSFAFFPNAIPKEVIIKQGISEDRLFLYNGYKEDVYLHDFTPNTSFPSSLPFENYVIVRPENIMANYIRNDGVQSITPDLLKRLSGNGVNILYLPRYAFDRDYAKGLKNIFIPDGPINGLDAVYYADAVFTGAGTLAREAGCLSVPSFSFFAGSDLLAVDKQMIKAGLMHFSRNPDELYKQFKSSVKTAPDLSRSKKAAAEIRDKLTAVIQQFS
jgi:predicted glycosyltransferase